jgi:hypothetical protein
MCDDYVADARVLLIVEGDGDAPGVYRDAVVNEKAAQALFERRAAVLVEGAW